MTNLPQDISCSFRGCPEFVAVSLYQQYLYLHPIEKGQTRGFISTYAMFCLVVRCLPRILIIRSVAWNNLAGFTVVGVWTELIVCSLSLVYHTVSSGRGPTRLKKVHVSGGHNNRLLSRLYLLPELLVPVPAGTKQAAESSSWIDTECEHCSKIIETASWGINFMIRNERCNKIWKKIH